MKIGVIMGGISSERAISIKSGEQVVKHLNREKYEAIIPIVIDKKEDVIDKIKGIDFAFLALHGTFGEDGVIQGLLEVLGIPYSGCGVMTSAICMNKAMTKMLFKGAGIRTPKWMCIKSIEEIDYEVIKEWGYPVMVKPKSGGSSIATFRITKEEDIECAVEEALKYDIEVLVEKYIDGEEMTSFVLGGKVFPIVTIRAQKGAFFNYVSKYEVGGAEEIVEFLEEREQEEVYSLAKSIWHLLGCKGYCRIDMIRKDGTFYILEVNTLPGLTTTSLIPKSAEAMGMSFGELLDQIISCSK